jgi:phytoene dehydrogenase-like protein
MGALSEALAASARAAGAAIETSAPVERILVEGGRAAGAVLAGGREVRARIVLSSADPKTTFLRLVAPSELPEEFRSRVAAIDMASASAKINLALDGLPAFRGLSGASPEELRGTIHIAPDLDFIERAYIDALGGSASREPVLECTIPSTLDSTIAPAGKHVMSIFLQYAPYRLAAGSWDDAGARDALADRALALLEEHAPGFRARVLALEVLTPLDLERVFALPGGNIFHGAMGLHQLGFLRPVPGWSRYRTPVRGLYLCGAGAHPGGGVMGACGRNAALAVLSDRKSLLRG